MVAASHYAGVILAQAPPRGAEPAADPAAVSELLMSAVLLFFLVSALAVFIVYYGRFLRRSIRRPPHVTPPRRDAWYDRPMTDDEEAAGEARDADDGHETS